jgi:hypothetical protein
MKARKETEEIVTARKWFCKHVPVAMNIHTTEELLEVVFPMQSMRTNGTSESEICHGSCKA